MLFYSLPEISLMIALAIAVDWLVGDPKWPTHPVILIGRLIKRLEGRLYPETDGVLSAGAMRLRGVALTVCTVIAAGAATMAVVWAAALIHPWLGFAVNVWFVSTTIAVKGLKDAAMLVYRPLKRGDLAEARKYAGYIVGRDTDRLDEREASRAAIETVAENTTDALVAPLVFALLGGAPLAMLYRAANTLDSMVGYRNERYLHFGWASARLDDILNYAPARLTGLLMIAAAVPLRGLSPVRALRAIVVFARLHPSPNSGIPEAAAAGALGIELGGVNSYFGVRSERARMGWPLRSLETEDIVKTVRLLYAVSMLLFVWGLTTWWITR
ncbi:adenosylcobinamide-phosphate synthase CbiB [uncultured Paenibacillus sp.]|uniref:adenosylcobinamide-phosphate synthase CbiB n=1 Tax=uncultured Paenibacillus sp. TaxID=227322 RepID=UPI0028D0806C|nr:adenosylcobinamide-phosphate synthase CbiB [uncultured Paenibacillus sp.]